MPDFIASLALPIAKTARLELLHPVTFQPMRDQDGNPAWIDLLSFESAEAHQHRMARDNAIRRLGRDFTAEEDWRDLGEMYAKLTVAWHLVSLDARAVAIPCDFTNAAALYNDPATRWLRLLVQAHIANRGNFFPLDGSATSAAGQSTSGGSTSEPEAEEPGDSTTKPPPESAESLPAP